MAKINTLNSGLYRHQGKFLKILSKAEVNSSLSPFYL